MYRYMKLHDWINLDKINWSCLSENPSAMHLLEQSPDKINWGWLSGNPFIFTYDYPKLRQSRLNLHEDLIQHIWCPPTIQKWSELHCKSDEDAYEIYEYFYA